MVSNNLYHFQSIETELRSAMNLALHDFSSTPNSNPNFLAITSLQRNLETAAQKIAKKNNTISNRSISNPPKFGYSISFGIQILVGYKIRFRGNANLGFGHRWNNFGATSSLHIAAYNGGLGTGFNKKNMVVDLTAAVNLTVGSGQGVPLQSYSLNYNSPIPTLNEFKNSFSYGQLLTWNSGINKNKFSLDRIQREGMIGFRLGNVNVSTNNDTRRFYFGDGGDKSWTGGISVATPLFEVGFQDFSGDYLHHAEEEKRREELNQEIKNLKRNAAINSFTKKQKIEELETRLKLLTEKNYHNQNSYQKNLNKASTYIRINKNGYNATIDLIGDAWLQNAIHKAIKDFKFEYNYKNVEVWGGKNW